MKLQDIAIEDFVESDGIYLREIIFLHSIFILYVPQDLLLHNGLSVVHETAPLVEIVGQQVLDVVGVVASMLQDALLTEERFVIQAVVKTLVIIRETIIHIVGRTSILEFLWLLSLHDLFVNLLPTTSNLGLRSRRPQALSSLWLRWLLRQYLYSLDLLLRHLLWRECNLTL